jgi:tripartite-type tricarboxylate transporter receptor subunit TctC
LIVALILGFTPLMAADYPTKPITIMVPWPAGASTDATARIIASIAEKEIKQPVMVVNKAGAMGLVGWSEIPRMNPDGYNLGMINLPHMLSAVLDPERKATFKAEDITPIISLGLEPTTITVNPESPWKTLKELIDDAKKRPGQISAGIVGYLTDDEIGYFQFAEAAGIELKRVYFEGAAPAITALLGKHVEVIFCSVGDNFMHWKAGRVRMLAIMDKERTKFIPDMPTTVELGFPSVISAATLAMAAPKGVPEPIKKRIEEIFKKAAENQDFITKMEAGGHPVKIIYGEEFKKYYWDVYQVAKKWVERARK